MSKDCVQVKHVGTKDRAKIYLATLSPVGDLKEVEVIKRTQHSPT